MNTELFSRMQYEPCILMLGDSYDQISETVFNYNWNMIVTTNCELKFSAILDNGNRIVKDLFCQNDMQANLLDKKNLHVIRLLGKQGIPEEAAELEIEDMIDDAFGMLKRVADIVSQNGIILIENFDNRIVNHQLIRKAFRNLYQEQKQIHIFHYDGNCQYINDLENQGVAVTYKESLSQFFEEFTGNEESIDAEENLLHIYINDKATSIEEKILLESEYFSTVLNIQLFNEIKIHRNMYQDYFYMFLKNSIREPQWYGYYYGFNLHRIYEEDLYKKVIKGLEHVGRAENKPLLVVGQTGTGKSISLAAVSYKIFLEKRYPVVYINDPNINFYSNVEYKKEGMNRKDSPEFLALDRLLQHLENMGAKATLLVWDSSCYSTDRKKCYRLYQSLRARGRKLYLVGTAYESREHNIPEEQEEHVEEVMLNKKFVECKAEIKLHDEIDQLRDILSIKCRFNLEQVDKIINTCAKSNKNFLALFYQAFNILRGDLSRGVYKEVNFSMQEIDRLVIEEAENEISNCIMGDAIKKIGKQLIGLGIVESTPEKMDSQEKQVIVKRDAFIQCIAICSQFKLKIPYDFALRILGTYNYKIIHTLSSSTFFVITEDYYGNYEISLRTPLEAQMYLDAKGILVPDQIESVKMMLENMRASGQYGQQMEVKLCERLVRIMGPNSDEYAQRYKVGYATIIESLRQLREDRDIWEPILVSQEITYIREYYGRGEAGLSEEDRIAWLKKAIKIADQMFSRLNYAGVSLGIKNALIVESSNSKLLLCQLLKTNDIFLYKELRRDLRDVIKYDSQNYHAYVTLLKGSIIEYGNEQNSIKKMEILESMCSVADELVFENPDVANSEYFQQKVAEIYSLLDDSEVLEKYIDELVQNGSAAGVYVVARKELYNAGVDFRQGISEGKQQEVCKNVYRMLNEEKYHMVVADSEPCQYLLLNLIWLINNKEPIFKKGECWRTYMNSESWKELLNACNNYISKFCNDSTVPHKFSSNIKYVKALCLAQLEQYIECLNVLRSIEEDGSLGLPRTFTKHMICDEKGIPKKFEGRLGKYDSVKRTGEVFIDEFGKSPLYYHVLQIDTSKNDEGIFFKDLEVGLSNISPKIYRNIENERKIR